MSGTAGTGDDRLNAAALSSLCKFERRRIGRAVSETILHSCSGQSLERLRSNIPVASPICCRLLLKRAAILDFGSWILELNFLLTPFCYGFELVPCGDRASPVNDLAVFVDHDSWDRRRP